MIQHLTFEPASYSSKKAQVCKVGGSTSQDQSVYEKQWEAPELK